ncbi:MAG TPA: hypothetical protein VGW36_09580 [Pyrinomonadaceae bacterium]|nr:hypothetical protein [Pyrinomonadaceae bacterium]
MTKLKAICTAIVLTLALCAPAYAGDISSPGLTTPGEIGTPGSTGPGDGSTPGETEPIPGEINTPGFMNILGTLLSVF